MLHSSLCSIGSSPLLFFLFQSWRFWIIGFLQDMLLNAQMFILVIMWFKYFLMYFVFPFTFHLDFNLDLFHFSTIFWDWTLISWDIILFLQTFYLLSFWKPVDQNELSFDIGTNHDIFLCANIFTEMWTLKPTICNPWRLWWYAWDGWVIQKIYILYFLIILFWTHSIVSLFDSQEGHIAGPEWKSFWAKACCTPSA